MTSLLHSFTAIMLSVLMMVSTTSIAVYSHFCGAFLQDVSFFAPSDGCGMEMMDSCDASHEKPGCCNDEQDVVKGQDELQTRGFELASSLSLFIETAQQQYSFLPLVSKRNRRQALTYQKPPPDLPLYIYYESLLI